MTPMPGLCGLCRTAVLGPARIGASGYGSMKRGFSRSAYMGGPTRLRSPPPPPRYPPTRSPEPIVFDEPAVPFPHRTANQQAAFKRYSRMAMYVGGMAIVLGGTIYVGWHSLDADERSSTSSSLSHIETLYSDLKSGISESQPAQTAQFMLLSLRRSTTIIKAVALCVWDYRRTLNAKYASKDDEEESLRKCHLRSAQRLLVALQTNGGLYIKLGQHMSSVILLPPEWTTTLRPLQDQNEPTPLPELEALFHEETGKTFDEAFSWMDEKPLGVASLAQVHKARDRETGQMLAVKMLHPNVERFSQVDMRMVTILVHWVKRVFPDFAFDWLADEMNKNMPLELDFRHEAGNSSRAQRDFEQYKNTCVAFPKVPWVYRRVMAMEFVEGSRPDNLTYLAEHKIDRNRVSQELSRIFAQMLYMHGFFHADPHGGNVLIRPRQPGSRSSENFEIVLLDHGLYFAIDEELRSNYARFWLALLSRTTPHVTRERRKYAKLVGNIGDDLYPVLESAITGRSGLEGSDENNPRGIQGRERMSSLLDLDSSVTMSKEEQEHIRKTVMEKEGILLNVMELLRRVPRPLLMVLKINDLTRSLDANLHTTHGPARPFIITARYCALAARKNDKEKLTARRKAEGFSLVLFGDILWSWWNYVYFYDGLMFLEGLSNVRARIGKFALYVSTILRHGFDTQAAHMAVSGIADQEKTQTAERQARQQAMEALEAD
ncbi:Similar to S.cerevisiae protein MCP2 (Mitochondrial protein of unknown function involved in lipid homeostasis) [Malassezia sympodialis ATCC 42132]|uniref:Protein kinase domain-containing protein n=1 Tax=Malassezia sympodialis (strain ATCC 42132) TaxID=1230383 RepID=A0A1M8A769_MALS4|nr:Similar to S.cerevisiae protein MCP2 (Mitochondrial protein of unknown function involved in lipid homeostasis) [Malassezia sympodialis ATCC 42132]